MKISLILAWMVEFLVRRVNVTAGEEVKRHWGLVAAIDEEKESAGGALD